MTDTGLPEDPSFTMVVPSTAPTPDDALAAAISQALPTITTLQGSTPIPLGMTWQFDVQAGRFVTAGGQPVAVSGPDAVAMWCSMALKTARFAFRVFSNQFGIVAPESTIGVLVTGELLADYAEAAIDALMVHDRITDVQDFAPEWEASSRAIVIPAFRVILDDQQPVTLLDTRVSLAGGR